MLNPLTQFVCDCCGEVIESIPQGLVEWLTRDDGRHQGFRIVHVANGRTSCCAYASRPSGKLVQLERVTGTDGLAYVLSLLHPGNLHPVDPESCGVVDNAEYANFMRRLFLPRFEEARRYFDQARADGLHLDVGETDFYSEENLCAIIRRYGSE